MPRESLHHVSNLANIPGTGLQSMTDMPLDSILGHRQFNSAAAGLRERLEQEDKRNAELRSLTQALSLDYCLGLQQQQQQQPLMETQRRYTNHLGFQHNLGSTTGASQPDPNGDTPNSANSSAMTAPQTALHSSYGIFSLSEQQREAILNEQRVNNDQFSANLNSRPLVRQVAQQQQHQQHHHHHHQQQQQQQHQHHQHQHHQHQQHTNNHANSVNHQQHAGRTDHLLPPGANATVAKQLGQVFTPTSGYQQRISQSTTMPSESLHHVSNLANIPGTGLQSMTDMPLDSLLGYHQFNSAAAGLRERLEQEDRDKRNAEQLRSLTQALSLDYCLGLQQQQPSSMEAQRRYTNHLGFQHNLGSTAGASQPDPNGDTPNSANSSAMTAPQTALHSSYGIFSLSEQQREAILNEQRVNTDQFSANLNSRPLVRQQQQQQHPNAVANAVNQHVRADILPTGANHTANLGQLTSHEASIASAASLSMPPQPQQPQPHSNSGARLPQQQTSILTPPATQSPFRHTNTPSKPESYSAIVAKSTKMVNSSRSPPNQQNSASAAITTNHSTHETNNTASISSSSSSAHQQQTTNINSNSSNYNNHHYSTTPSVNNLLVNSNNDVGSISYTATTNKNSSPVTSPTNNSIIIGTKRKDTPPHGSATNLLGFMGLYVGNLSPDLTKEQLEKIFSKYGEPVKAHRLLRSPVAFIKYENTESPRAAIEDLYGVLLPHMTLNTDQPLKLHFDRNDSQLKSNYRPVELPERDNGECYNWRTTICRKGKSCPKKHIPINKGIDFQMWMIKPTSSTS